MTREETSALSQALERSFDLADKAFNIRRGNGAFGAGNANAVHQLIPVELFAGAILFNDERDGEYGAFYGAEALAAFFVLAFPAAAYTAVAVAGGIQHFGLTVVTIRTSHCSSPRFTGIRLSAVVIAAVS